MKKTQLIERVEIPLNKKKIMLLLICAILLFSGGIWITLNPENFTIGIFKYINPNTLKIWGISGAIFFGLALIFGIKKLLDRKAGLIIDENGITDNSNASSIGLIKWEDISGIKTKQILSAKFLLIEVKNPKEYIERTNNRMKTKLMQANMDSYGTPLSITSNTLKYDFEQLEKLIKKYLTE